LLPPLFVLLAFSTPLVTQTAVPAAVDTHSIAISVLDENGIAVSSAQVALQGATETRRCVTDPAGRCEFTSLTGGPWQLRVQKEGFYQFTLASVPNSGTLEVRVVHEQEVKETVNVVESPATIDPSLIAAQEQLSGLDILNIPYPNTRDYRYALAFIPGVVLDPNAQPHVAGAETYQTLVLLDGFDVTQPANGQLLARVSTDAIRAVKVETSRIPAQYGKGPAGILGLETGIGDDHYRFGITNFIPSVQEKKGLALDKVNPRFTFSGPIKKGKMWFFDGLDGEYDNVIIQELPPGEDTDHIWRLGNLAKMQADLAPPDILTASLLVNRLHDDHFKLSTAAPATATPEDSEDLYAVSIKEQHAFSPGKLLELGFAFNQYGLQQTPLGSTPYVLTPTGAQGNYFLTARTTASRWQALANFYAARDWHGRHDFMLGMDVERLVFDQFSERRPITSVRQDGSLARSSTFSGGPPSAIYNTEASTYLQDCWSLLPRLLIEPGVRFDWDQIIRRWLFSPRLAGTYVLDNAGNTKFSAGIGVFYESTNLLLIGQPLAGSRSDTFYDSAGNVTSTTLTTFTVDRGSLYAPRFLNWSVAFEQRLPHQVFLKAEFLQRNSTHGFVYDSTPGATSFVLQSTRQDRYHSLMVNLRHPFRERYVVTASYSRSSSRSNQVLDYSLDNLVLSPQVHGPYPWDAPNRFISWGLLPMVKGFDTAYSLEVRTGFPYAVINSQQQLVAPPGAHRFPNYFSLNLHLEKRFDAFGLHWALRGGFDNITNHQNPYVVNNVFGSPSFLTFSAFDSRAFTARIRILGRK
jgi:Carboxypeptidase regulatory-like domain